MNAPLVCGARRPTGLWWSGHGARLASGGLGTAPDRPLVVWARRPSGLWWSGHGARPASGGLGTAPEWPLVVWARRPTGVSGPAWIPDPLGISTALAGGRK